MRECRFCPWCSYIEDHGCTKDSCRHYQPMPDVDALLALADDLDYAGAAVENVAYIDQTFHESASRIREALGVEHGA